MPSIVLPVRTWVTLLILITVISVVVGYFWWPTPQPANDFQQGLQALADEDWKQLRRAATALEDVPGFENQAALLRGALLVKIHLPSQALDPLAQAVEHEATRLSGLVLMGEALYQLGRYREAEHVLEKAIRKAPEHVDAHRWLAAVYHDTGANRLALNSLQKVVELAPHDARPHLLKGMMHQTNEEFQQAIAAFRETLRLDPQQPNRDVILQELARAHIKLFDYAEALQVLADSFESADVLALQAECHHNQGRTDQARRLIERALELSSDHLPVLLLQGTIELEAGNLSAAQTALQQAIHAPLKNARPEVRHAARFQLAQVHRRLGQKAQAEEQLKILHTHQLLWQRFVDLHQQASDKPDNAEIRYQLSRLAQKLNRPDLAAMWHRAAVALDQPAERVTSD